MQSYPTVFLHGLGGWGEADPKNESMSYWGFDGGQRDLIRHLKDAGYEVFNPSLGPATSAWDRACELWAYLVGGRVDYGKVHSAKYRHKRFGRTYPGVLRDWGKSGAHERINLIGHSYGGPTAILFTELVRYGSSEEQQGTPDAELSDLFRPHRGRFHAIVTLSGVNNGTTFADFFGVRGMKAASTALYALSVLAERSGHRFSILPHTEQWGVHESGISLTDRLIRLRRMNRAYGDHIGFTMQVPRAAEQNAALRSDKDAYYFAFSACRTHDDRKGHHVPNDDMRPILKIWSTIIGRYKPKRLQPYGFDPSWLASDGIVNVRSHAGPFSLESRPFDGDFSAVRRGVWYNVSPVDKHHMSWVGLGEETTEAFLGFYDTLFRDIASLERKEAEDEAMDGIVDR